MKNWFLFLFLSSSTLRSEIVKISWARQIKGCKDSYSKTSPRRTDKRQMLIFNNTILITTLAVPAKQPFTFTFYPFFFPPFVRLGGVKQDCNATLRKQTFFITLLVFSFKKRKKKGWIFRMFRFRRLGRTRTFIPCAAFFLLFGFRIFTVMPSARVLITLLRLRLWSNHIFRFIFFFSSSFSFCPLRPGLSTL